MADIGIKTTWTMALDTVELRLVLKALGGRLKNSEEAEAAKVLGDKLTRMRIEATKFALTQADKTLSNMENDNV